MAVLPVRPFGTTGLTVTALGFGAMQAGAPELPEDAAAALLHGVLDLGIRVIDTARSYGLSEVRIGRHLARRRDEYLLSTKVGYGVDGVPDWTYECVRRGIDAARDRLRVDVIDVVHLHSCPLDTLLYAGVADALAAAVQRGTVRVAAYSGENDALDHAIERAAPGTAGDAGAAFGAVQLSVNVCESGATRRAVAARARGLGVVAKRPFAGLPWRASSAPEDPPTRNTGAGSRRCRGSRRRTGPSSRCATRLTHRAWTRASSAARVSITSGGTSTRWVADRCRRRTWRPSSRCTAARARTGRA